MALIVAIAGHRRAGKTFLASQIIDAGQGFGIKIEKLSFADPLKELFCQYKGISVATLSLPDVKENYRKELEQFSDKIKTEDPFCFTNKLLEKISLVGNYVIDDIRFLLEEVVPLLKLTEHKINIYRVYADWGARFKRGMVPDPKVDNSRYETELDLPQEIYMSWGGYYIYNSKDDPSSSMREAKLIVQRSYLRHLIASSTSA